MNMWKVGPWGTEGQQTAKISCRKNIRAGKNFHLERIKVSEVELFWRYFLFCNFCGRVRQTKGLSLYMNYPKVKLFLSWYRRAEGGKSNVTWEFYKTTVQYSFPGVGTVYNTGNNFRKYSRDPPKLASDTSKSLSNWAASRVGKEGGGGGSGAEFQK